MHTRESSITTTTTTMIPSTLGPTRRRRERSRAKRVNVVAGHKWCAKCERQQPLVAFGVARDRYDGLSAYCRSCKSADARKLRAANPEKHRAEVRARYAANPEIWHAHVAVSRAIARGEIEKPAPGTPCAECGRASRLEAHHYLGYAKPHWLDVKWCCRSCHGVEHRDECIPAEQTLQPAHAHPLSPMLRATAPRWASHGTHGTGGVGAVV